MRTKDQVKEAVENSEAKLQSLEPNPFSEKGFLMVKKNISGYVSDLITESIRVSTKKREDSVSESSVEQASANLISKRRSKLNYLAGTFGGIFLGATVSNIFGMMVLGQTFTTIGIVVTILFSILGSFMISLNLSND
jgi:hypothetical protein